MNVETTTQTDAKPTAEESHLIVEPTFLRDESGKTTASYSGRELLGPGANVGYPWDRFLVHQNRNGNRAWVRYLWQGGGVVAQLLATSGNVFPRLWAGWQLNRAVPGYFFLANFFNGPITARNANANIFMELWSGRYKAGYTSVPARSGHQPLGIFLRREVPITRVIVGANCEMNGAPANSYAEVIAHDIKVYRYSHTISGLADAEGAEPEFEGVPEFGDEALSPLTEEAKASGEWVGFSD